MADDIIQTNPKEAGVKVSSQKEAELLAYMMERITWCADSFEQMMKQFGYEDCAIMISYLVALFNAQDRSFATFLANSNRTLSQVADNCIRQIQETGRHLDKDGNPQFMLAFPRFSKIHTDVNMKDINKNSSKKGKEVN